MRKQGVQTANNYTRMLARLRNKEVERVSKILARQFDPVQWPGAVGTFVNEITYLPDWYRDRRDADGTGKFPDAGRGGGCRQFREWDV